MAKKASGGFDLNSKRGIALIGCLALVAAYIVAIRAIDTGSLFQYFLGFTLFGIGLNRLVLAIRTK